MKKLRLALDALNVDSFATADANPGAGTVRAHDITADRPWTCNASCVATGCDTCDNSVDYCTCANCPVPTDACGTTRDPTVRCM